jgi:uncharacterized membrane protein YgcG
VSIALLLITRARVDSLVAVYAIGVFTGFTMAGAGMSKYHWTNRGPGWQRKLGINGFAALLSFAVVIIFAVTKFTQGAWAVVVLFPIMWLGLTRLNRRYREEASVLGETIAEAAAEAQPLPRSVGIILVDRLDLATARAIQYARTLSLDDLRAVHFVIDQVRADRLQERWVRLGLKRFPLEMVDCPDRRVVRASLERANAELGGGQTELTVILPRRHYRRIWSRILHDATGEKIAATLSRLPHVAATILPLDVDAALRDRNRAPNRQKPVPSAHDLMVESESDVTGGDETAAGEPGGEPGGGSERGGGEPGGAETGGGQPGGGGGEPGGGGGEPNGARVPRQGDDRSRSVVPIAGLAARRRVRVAGRITSVTVQTWGSVPTLQCELQDESGSVQVAFLGRRRIAGIAAGNRMEVSGMVGERNGRLVLINPDYDLIRAAGV